MKITSLIASSAFACSVIRSKKTNNKRGIFNGSLPMVNTVAPHIVGKIPDCGHKFKHRIFRNSILGESEALICQNQILIKNDLGINWQPYTWQENKKVA